MQKIRGSAVSIPKAALFAGAGPIFTQKLYLYNPGKTKADDRYLRSSV